MPSAAYHRVRDQLGVNDAAADETTLRRPEAPEKAEPTIVVGLRRAASTVGPAHPPLFAGAAATGQRRRRCQRQTARAWYEALRGDLRCHVRRGRRMLGARYRGHLPSWSQTRVAQRNRRPTHADHTEKAAHRARQDAPVHCICRCQCAGVGENGKVEVGRSSSRPLTLSEPS